MNVRLIGAAVVGGRALFGVVIGSRLVPDTSWYLGEFGGWWFYPSPLGRAFGAFGLVGLAVTSVVFAAALGYVVVALAQGVGSRGYFAIVIMVAAPAAWYVQPVALDNAGAFVVCAAVLYGRWQVGVSSLLLHPASGVGYVCGRAWSGGIAAVLTLSTLAACSVVAALLTPYAGIITRASVRGVVPAFITLGIASFPFLWLRFCGYRYPSSPARYYAVWSAAMATLVVFLQGGVQVRYFLPATALIASVVRR